MTPEERRQCRGFNSSSLFTRASASAPVRQSPLTCPAGDLVNGSTCDWRAAGAVTPVKDQGQCGSCWAFSATGATESAWFLARGQLLSLSEQNLVDCSWLELNLGCNGGQPARAFDYIQKHGIESEEDYPYTAHDGRCQFNASKIVATLSTHHDLYFQGEDALANAITTVGPISVAIDASHDSFQFYSSGVYYEPACHTLILDHAVLAVGIGSVNDTDYYIVKNSWGDDWGNNGYILMSRNRDNNCGIATFAAYPVV